MSKGGLSRGTAKTALESLGNGSTVRREGRLVTVPFGEKLLDVDFGSYKTSTMNISWGDVSTAWRSTAIPNIEVYMGASERLIRYAKLSRYINWLLRRPWFRQYLRGRVDKRRAGPTERQRSGGRSLLWGRVWDDQGEVRESVMETSSGYTLTAKTSVFIAEKILLGKFKPGYQTPAMAFGADLILASDNASRIDR